MGCTECYYCLSPRGAHCVGNKIRLRELDGLSWGCVTGRGGRQPPAFNKQDGSNMAISNETLTYPW